MLEDKLEALTTEMVKLRQIVEKAMPGLLALADADSGEEADEKPAPAKKPAPKKVEPEHDADEVAAIMRKAAKEVDKDAVMSYIAEQECEDLADLLTKPELFDAAFEFATGQLGGDEGEDDDI